MASAHFLAGDHRITHDVRFDDVQFDRGARLVVDGGATVRVRGQVLAAPDVEIFAGEDERSMRPTELSTYLRDARSCTIRIQGAQSVTLHNVYLAANERRAHVLFEIGEGGGNNAPFAYLGIWTYGQGEDECAGKPKYAVDFHLSDDPEWCGGAKIQITNFYYRAYNSSGDATADEGGDAVRPDLNTPWGVEISNAEIYSTHGIRTRDALPRDPDKGPAILNSLLIVGRHAIVNLSGLARFTGERQEDWPPP